MSLIKNRLAFSVEKEERMAPGGNMPFVFFLP
jgi:hypothetical protein